MIARRIVAAAVGVAVAALACAACDPGPQSVDIALYRPDDAATLVLVRTCIHDESVRSIGIGNGHDRWAKPAEYLSPSPGFDGQALFAEISATSSYADFAADPGIGLFVRVYAETGRTIWTKLFTGVPDAGAALVLSYEDRSDQEVTLEDFFNEYAYCPRGSPSS